MTANTPDNLQLTTLKTIENERSQTMKNIKSLADIEVLNGTNVPEKVLVHIPVSLNNAPCS